MLMRRINLLKTPKPRTSLRVRYEHNKLRKEGWPEELVSRMDNWDINRYDEPAVSSLYELMQEIELEEHKVTYIGEFEQTNPRTMETRKIPFFIAQTNEQTGNQADLEGKMCDTYGIADIKGKISQQNVEFTKRYAEGSSNSNEIKYTGILDCGEYKGEWAFESMGQIAKGPFKMKKYDPKENSSV